MPGITRRLSAAIAGLVLLAMLTGPAPASASAPALGASTVVHATSLATTLVELHKPAELVLTGNQSDDVEITGRGRAFGVVLVPQKAERNLQSLLIMVSGGCWEAGCRPEAPFRASEYIVPTGWDAKRELPDGKTAYSLTAGTYRLIAVADGAPMTARIKFRGLSGSARISPSTPVNHRHLTFQSSGGPAGVTPYHSADAGPFDVTSRLGLLYSVRGQSWSPYIMGYEGDCFYRDAGPLAGTHLPGCPTSFDGVRYSVDYPGPVYYGQTTVMKLTGEPGRWTHGGWKVGAGGPSWIRMTQLWMDLGEQDFPPPESPIST